MPYKVKTIADIAGVSVRLLHHYDEIGLLKPHEVSNAGYRLYSDSDLERLQQILFFRELDFPLRDSKRIMSSPNYDTAAALNEHRHLLIEKRGRLERLIATVEESICSLEGGSKMSKDEMFQAFDEAKIEQYKEEIREKYGSEALDESERRTSKYNKRDWDDIQAEAADINENIAALMDKDPGDPQVQAQIGRWYKHINDRFYTCTPEIFRGLGQLYVDDKRFTAFYEKIKPGMAGFMREAMRIYSDSISA